MMKKSKKKETRPIDRPPTPDLTKKWALQSEENIKLIKQVYLKCFNDIQKISLTGNVRSGYTGLFNIRNTCFMNTTLQALFNTPQLQAIFTSADFFEHINELNTKGTKGVISACFSALLDSVWSGKFIAIRPELFLKVFASEVCADLADKRQHDAQEFQIYLLNALHEDMNKVAKPEPFEQNYDGHDLAKNAEDYKARQNRFSSSPVNDVFNLRTVSQLSCSVCRSTSVTFEEMNQISVELPQETSSSRLSECLAQHFSDITLVGENCWNCPTCKKPQAANRDTKIWELPPVLVIHLKRFSWNGGIFTKNEMMIDFEVDGWMNMEPYLHSKALKQKSTYSLYAITNHGGTLNGGHYTSFIRNRLTHEWLEFDDEYCTAISPDLLKSKTAFILYYTNQNFFTGHP
uniref:ubiquitinyl hydrolase 1 n=1 Tax=Acrobeloides nanus TaxID=290746 RepID=A0A914DX97_9BILA